VVLTFGASCLPIASLPCPAQAGCFRPKSGIETVDERDISRYRPAYEFNP